MRCDECSIFQEKRAEDETGAPTSTPSSRLFPPQTSIAALPIELLAEIFELVVIEGVVRHGFLETDCSVRPSSQAHKLGQVCAHWRRIAYGTPKLWNKAPIYVRLGTEELSPRHLAQLGAALTRSEPLSIVVALKHAEGADSDLVAALRDRIEEAVLPTTERWRALSLTAPDLGSLARKSFPGLESLHLSGLAKQQDPIDQFLGCSRLRMVRLQLRNTLDMTSVLLPWSRLTTLSLHESSLDVCSSILQLCTNLVTAQIFSKSYPAGASTVGAASIQTLPFLQNLEVNCQIPKESRDTTHLGAFLAPFAFPALASLSLTFTRVFWRTEQITACLGRSPGIDTLQLALPGHVSVQHVLEVIRCAPKLQSLSVSRKGHTDDALMNALCVSSSPSSEDETGVPTVRLLRTLRLDCGFRLESLERLLQSRSGSTSSSLQHLYVYTGSCPGRRWVKQLRAMLKEFEEKGMKLHLEY
ncbi:unnamed protein product [Mycena citricolor]|uniref:F-box domain-containing protein n=1 Tax=Mycena citricolor TaxID=2018698 RepID=A0AAD2H029_9AGAR|nr:unnamed protein product [Mycena citricolor]